MKLRLFGSVVVVGPEGEVSAGPPAQKRLLALLALRTGHLVSTDWLVEEMWGEEAPANARQIVRTYVSRLRKILECGDGDRATRELLVTEPGGYRLALHDDDVDLLRFERLVRDGEALGDVGCLLEALRLWRDEPLSEFPYDDFAVRLRERLELRRLDALEARLAMETQTLVSGAALDELRQLVAMHPLRERLWSLLIAGLYRSGRQTEALRTCGRCRSTLAEVGLEPGPELQDLEEAILCHDEALLAAGPASNLPAEVDRFIGRVDELEQLSDLLGSVRLVTVVGAAGTGKTRLAVEAARHRTGGPAWFVDLAAVTDPASVHEAVLDALGMAQRSGTDPLSVAARALAGRPGLLLVDNCEHVIDPASLMIERLLNDCADLAALATSREPLRVRGETVMAIPPLQLPSSDDLDAIAASDAGQLLIERTRAVLPDFEVTRDNAPSIVAILGYVEGIPLAIELVAVQLQSTPLDRLAGSLGEALAWPKVPRRTARARHRTLTAALDWSYRLLEPSEQDLFRVLGVLLTDFDETAAVALGGSPVDLAALVTNSMVTRVGGARYRLLAPVRHYATALLGESGRFEAAETARNEHFAKLAAELVGGFRRWDEAVWQHRFAADRVHLIAALEALHNTDPERSATLATGIVRYCSNLGLYSEGRRLAERALLATTDPTLQVDLLRTLGWMLLVNGAYAEARVRFTAAMELASEHSNESGVAAGLNVIGVLHAERGEIRLAREKLLEAAGLYEVSRPDEWNIPVANLCWVEAYAGNVAEANAIINHLHRATEAGDTPASNPPSLNMLAGITARMSGDLVAAERLLAESVRGYATELDTYDRSQAIHEYAIVHFERGHSEYAEKLATMAIDPTDVRAERGILRALHSQRLLARLALRRGDPITTRSLLKAALHQALSIEDAGGLAEIADTAAELAAITGEKEAAAKLLAWSDRQRDKLGLARDPHDQKRAAALRTELPPPSLQEVATDAADLLAESLE